MKSLAKRVLGTAMVVAPFILPLPLTVIATSVVYALPLIAIAGYVYLVAALNFILEG